MANDPSQAQSSYRFDELNKISDVEQQKLAADEPTVPERRYAELESIPQQSEQREALNQQFGENAQTVSAEKFSASEPSVSEPAQGIAPTQAELKPPPTTNIPQGGTVEQTPFGPRLSFYEDRHGKERGQANEQSPSVQEQPDSRITTKNVDGVKAQSLSFFEDRNKEPEHGRSM